MKTKNVDLTIHCLDHGFVTLRNLSGPIRREGDVFDADDTDPAATARISFDQMDIERTREMDLKLVGYLMRNKHNTPIEMIEVWLEMKLPIFIARQFVRHRTACINEVSARYSVLPAEWYIPEVVGAKPTSGAKQGQENTLDASTQLWFRTYLDEACRRDYHTYKRAVSEEGIAPEHARLLLHVNHYTHWVWKQDLHNLMHFLALRLDGHAQVEARVYAQAVYDLLQKFLPETMKFFDEYRRL